MPLGSGPREVFVPYELQQLVAFSLATGLAKDYQNEFTKVDVFLQTFYRLGERDLGRGVVKKLLIDAIQSLRTYQEWLTERISEYNRLICKGNLSQLEQERLRDECMYRGANSEDLETLTADCRRQLISADDDIDALKDVMDECLPKICRLFEEKPKGP